MAQIIQISLRLGMPQTVKLLIDPATLHELNPENMPAILAIKSFLKNDKSEGVWASHEPYKYTYQNIKYQFSFSQSLLKRKKKEGGIGERYEIYNPNKSPLGKGGFGIVYPVVGTIKFQANEIIFKSESARVIKIESHDDQDHASDVNHEYQGLLDSGHLHPNRPVFTNDMKGKKSFLIMDKADGIPLEKILHPTKRTEIAHQIPSLTVHIRLELTVAILNAIKTQVLDKGLIHRDIKPWNIIIDFNAPIKATIIDYGLYLKQGEQDLRMAGTRAYRAPESFRPKPIYTQQADMYSVGRVLSYLWGDEYSNYYISKKRDLAYIKSKSTNQRLFNDPDIRFFLAKNDQKKIRTILRLMLLEEPGKRPGIEQTIEQFSQIDIDKYKNKTVPLAPGDFKNKLAQQIRDIRFKIILLEEKAQNLRNRGYIKAAKTMDHLVNELNINTDILAIKPEPHILLGYQKCCIKEIERAKKTLRNHRDLWWLLAEIASAICLLGVGYIIALGVNYLYTNRIGLFSQTKSDRLIEDMKDTVLEFPAV